jgi:pyruvate dehydrogenase E2 component (dihydrolipoamide acetyltransferase)
MSGGTITVTNVGASGPVETGTPIINPPECCVVAFGAIKPRAMVVDSQVVARSGAWISISVDHRIVDGALATEFLTALVAELESIRA